MTTTTIYIGSGLGVMGDSFLIKTALSLEGPKEAVEKMIRESLRIAGVSEVLLVHIDTYVVEAEGSLRGIKASDITKGR